MTNALTGFTIRPEWLAATVEPALDPAQPVVDAHHHLYDRPGTRYLLQDYLADIQPGHDIRASVAVQARAMLRADGPLEMRPTGETEFLNGMAAMSASGIYGPARVCAGIVGFADLLLGDAVRPVLERQIMAGGGLSAQGGRFCGIRMPLAWDADVRLLNSAYPSTRDMIDSSAFRVGFTHLAELGLSFDVWAFYPQMSDIARLARAFPQTRIVVDHCGGVVRVGAHAGCEDLFDIWRAGLDVLASCPNVTIKLSGLGMELSGFDLPALDQAPGSRHLARLWRPWLIQCVEAFGPERCMWGSNFPVDKGSHSLTVGLNAVKCIFGHASQDERDAIFWRTACQFYGIALPEPSPQGS